LDRLTR
jgi:tRNA-specific adenosine deaminase 1